MSDYHVVRVISEPRPEPKVIRVKVIDAPKTERPIIQVKAIAEASETVSAADALDRLESSLNG